MTHLTAFSGYNPYVIKKNPPIYPNLHQLKECFSQTYHVKMTLGDVSWKSVEILRLIILGI